MEKASDLSRTLMAQADGGKQPWLGWGSKVGRALG